MRSAVRDYYDRTQAAMDRGELPDQRTQQSVYLAGEQAGAGQTNLFLARRAGVRAGERILDAGCGSAGPAIDLARAYPGLAIEAVTLSPNQVARARARVAAAGLSQRICVREADFHALGGRGARFDRAVYLESLFHSDDLGAAMAEAHRVLRPGGTIYVKDMLRREGRLDPAARRDLARFERETETRVLVASEVVAAMEAAGFEDVRVGDFSDRVEAELFFARMRERGLARLPVGWGDIRARKPGRRRSRDRAAPVFALGTLGFDFGSEARRDSFAQAMAGSGAANPWDPRQLLAHLDADPSEAGRLIWTLAVERTPVYALAPRASFAPALHDRLRALLGAQLRGEVERASVPGRLSGRRIRLFSGQVVPELELASPRGLYGWTSAALVDAAIAAGPTDTPELRAGLRSFLDRIYHESRNLGRRPSARALNFAATNAVQSSQALREGLAMGLELADIDVRRSEICRADRDCWDVDLRLFDAHDVRRSERVVRFCVDVSDLLPVTVGPPRSWSARRDLDLLPNQPNQHHKEKP